MNLRDTELGKNIEETLDEGLSRSEFVKALVGVFSVFWAGLASYPVFRYLVSSSRQKDEVTEVTSLSLGPVEAFPVATGKNFRFGSKPALITRLADGSFRAYNAVCTHLGCTVQYSNEKKNIWCACHGGQFDADTGRNMAGPPPKPLTALKAEIINGEIIVSKA